MGEATAMKRVEEPVVVKQSSPFEEVEQTLDALARRAYEIFDGNGRIFGRDLDNWLQAEREFLHPVAVNMTETQDAITVRAEVPGFTEKEIEVAVDADRVVITGKKESSKEETKGKMVYAETQSNQLMRVVDLPAGIQSDKASATIKNGALELLLPKAAQIEPLRIHPKAAS